MPKITQRSLMNDAPSHHFVDASMYEAMLRKLTRAKLQRLAKKNKIKANMKSETIIQELLKLYKAVQLHQGEGNEEHLRKTGRTSTQDQPPSEPTRIIRGEIPLVACASPQIIDTAADTNLDHSQEASEKSALTGSAAPITVAKDAADIAAVSSANSEILQGPLLVLESHTGRPAPLDDDDSDFSDDDDDSWAILVQKHPELSQWRLSIDGFPNDD